MLKATTRFRKAMAADNLDDFDRVVEPYYQIMAESIAQQKARLGGTFAVAHAVASRRSRDYLRRLLGPDLVFLVLNLTEDCVRERLKQRHGAGSSSGVLERMYKLYQPAGDDEENAFNVTVDSNMTKDEVLQNVLAIVRNI